MSINMEDPVLKYYEKFLFKLTMQCWGTFQINSAHIFLKKVRGYFSFCLIFFLNRLLLLFCFHAQIDRITHRRSWLYGSNKSFTKKQLFSPCEYRHNTAFYCRDKTLYHREHKSNYDREIKFIWFCKLYRPKTRT